MASGYIGADSVCKPVVPPAVFSNRRRVMKVGIVGAGSVGRACALCLAGRGCAREIVLVDRTRTRAEAVATDIRYGLPLLPRAEITAGDYDSLASSALIM